MRRSNKHSLRNAIAVIVDGMDEKWYIEKIKEHYPCRSLKLMGIKPELPEKKKVDDIFIYAKNKVAEEYSQVILILDMDTILRVDSEFSKFKIYYEHYITAKASQLKGKQKSSFGWMEKLLLIVNIPCLEFWYLLHYKKTKCFYADFAALEPELKKCKGLEHYNKSEVYYKRIPDIYLRLGGELGIANACRNSHEFFLPNAYLQGVSEMNKLFEFFDQLDREK